MEKCGLKYEGTLRNHLRLKDGYHDIANTNYKDIVNYINEYTKVN